jgi:hypothetical protein
MNSRILFLPLLIIIVVILYKQRKNKTENSNNSNNEVEEPIIEMENIFYDKIQSGSEAYKLLAIYSQYDLMFLKSLFLSEQIPYHTEFEHMSRLKPGIEINNYNGTYFYILDEDYEDSIKVVDAYLESKSNDITIKTKIRNVAEMALMGWYIQPNSTASIKVFRKSKKTSG